jgi:hypothetical protein
MKILINFKTVCFFLLSSVLISCKKNDSGSDTVKSPFTVRYEITATKPLDPQPFGTGVMWTNPSGAYTTSFITSLPWKKDETVTNSGRPFLLILNADALMLTSPGQVVGNIYINGVKKETVTVNTTNIVGFNTAVLNMQYAVR